MAYIRDQLGWAVGHTHEGACPAGVTSERPSGRVQCAIRKGPVKGFAPWATAQIIPMQHKQRHVLSHSQ